MVLLARRENVLNEVLLELEGKGHLVVPYDLTELEGIPDLLKRVAQTTGPFDALVHAAGMHSTMPLRSVTSDHVAEIFARNVSSAFMIAKGFRNKQVRSGQSSIVLLSSAVGLVGQAGVSSYSATKGAIASLTRSLALELARESIRVNCVSPGIVLTELTAGIRRDVGEAAFAEIEAAHPIGVGEAIDVANAILYLCSPASRWVTGSNLVIDGGYTAQ